MNNYQACLPARVAELICMLFCLEFSPPDVNQRVLGYSRAPLACHSIPGNVLYELVKSVCQPACMLSQLDCVLFTISAPLPRFELHSTPLNFELRYLITLYQYMVTCGGFLIRLYAKVCLPYCCYYSGISIFMYFVVSQTSAAYVLFYTANTVKAR